MGSSNSAHRIGHGATPSPGLRPVSAWSPSAALAEPRVHACRRRRDRLDSHAMRLRHVLPIAALCLSALSVAPHAHADTPPDVVMLKNGGMLRGTIQEMDPQGNVVVELASG